jgi:hypothetical protein
MRRSTPRAVFRAPAQAGGRDADGGGVTRAGPGRCGGPARRRRPPGAHRRPGRAGRPAPRRLGRDPGPGGRRRLAGSPRHQAPALASGDLVAANRVAQEALTNVARHARASSARVELAGGTWTVWSRPGAGTVLTASLPKALVAARPRPGRPPRHPGAAVDDNRGFRNELRLLLEDCGIEVVAEGRERPGGGRAGHPDRRLRLPGQGPLGGLVLYTTEQAWASRAGGTSPN